MADPLTAEELEMLADLQARKRAADEAAELAAVQFRDAGIISEPLPEPESSLPSRVMPEEPFSTEELLQRLRIPRMRMDGMGAGPRPMLPHEEAVRPRTYNLRRIDLPEKARADMLDMREEDALEAMLDKAAEEDEME